MRDIIFWLSGVALAFLVTAGAFLLLANLATAPSEKRLNPDQARGGSGHSVDLILDREQLASLRDRPNQSLALVVENEGGEQLSDVNVNLSVISENTAPSDPRYYRQLVEKVPTGEAASVPFEFDLLVREEPGANLPTANPEPSREILEIRATTPEGNSTVRTVILPPEALPASLLARSAGQNIRHR
ncbi:MAG TPA: hypothetical protein VE691_12955 [Rubrobacter sp.]|jgi:hypothetical protein|nr:hypothetical protein [Rubrobacter sp.]